MHHGDYDGSAPWLVALHSVGLSCPDLRPMTTNGTITASFGEPIKQYAGQVQVTRRVRVKVH